MKKLIKENFVLLMGILLPVILIIAFAVSNKTSTIHIERTKSDFLFSTVNYNYNQDGPSKVRIKFIIKNKQLYARATKEKRNINQNNILYRYNSKKDFADELDFYITEEMENLEEGETRDYLIEATKDLKLSRGFTSKDGYKYVYSYGRRYGLMGGIFGYGYNSKRRHTIQNSNNESYPILIDSNLNNIYSKLNFISWVENNE